MAARIFLAFSALLWLPYGVYCFFDPGFLAGAAGVVSQSPTASTELRAMYGGLQTAIGALALAASCGRRCGAGPSPRASRSRAWAVARRVLDPRSPPPASNPTAVSPRSPSRSQTLASRRVSA
jgi:hypothetical protein